MNVYVESNFLLELVYEQEQFAACEDLLQLAERRSLRLLVPVFALVEPLWTLVKESNKRQEFSRQAREMHNQLRRNQSLGAESHRLSADLDALLTLSAQQEDQLLRQTRQRLLQHATVLPNDAATLRDAETAATQHDLQYFDAIMFASVMQDLPQRNREPACFLNRNSRDFATVKIRDELRSWNCEFKPGFTSGQAYVRAALGLPPPP